MGELHVIPAGDLMDHDQDPTCLCGPRVDRVDGAKDVVVVHHSLDGREREER